MSTNVDASSDKDFGLLLHDDHTCIPAAKQSNSNYIFPPHYDN